MGLAGNYLRLIKDFAAVYTSEHYLKEKQFISLKDHATTTESYKYPERHVKIVTLKEELADYDFNCIRPGAKQTMADFVLRPSNS